VGAKDLLEQLDKAETALKTNINHWEKTRPELVDAIENLLKFTQENPNWARGRYK
jgi:hypothetical protein